MQQDDHSTDLPSLAPEMSSEQSLPGNATDSTQSVTATNPLPVMGGTPLGNGASPLAAQHTTTPLQAADNDLIEKEWVIKAKQIVEKTKDNPYEQQKAIEKFKADYMKKRYNKTIKVTDS